SGYGAGCPIPRSRPRREGLMVLKSTWVAAITLSITMAVCAAAEVAPNPSIGCLRSLADRPDLQVLKDKVALLDPRDQTLEMLASSKKPTKAEASAISTWVTEQEHCTRLADDWRATNVPPRVNALVNQFLVDYMSLAADLYVSK